MESTLKRTFASLSIRNFRLFVIGQGISMCGTWMAVLANSWLVLQLTHSGTQLGLVVASQFIPVLLFGVWGGIIADRFSKRHILYVTNTLFGIFALTLGLVVILHVVQLWMVYLISVLLGIVTIPDSPARQSFFIEMVGPDKVKNAVTLNAIIVNVARMIGPAIGGILIVTVGIGTCFIFNATSFLAVLLALYLMNDKEIIQAPRTEKGAGQIRAGLAYVWGVPALKSTLIMMFIIGTFAYEFPVILPLFATVTLHGNAGTYSSMTVAFGMGAVLGGLYTAGRATTKESHLIWSAILFGLSIIIAAASPSYIAAIVFLFVVGILSIVFISLGNATLQINSDPSMRGRVMSLWAVAFLGTTPIGGPFIGWISDHTNPRIGLATGGFATVLAGLVGLYIYKRGITRPKSISYLGS